MNIINRKSFSCVFCWSLIAIFCLLEEFLNTSFGLFSKGITNSLHISFVDLTQISTVFFAIYAGMQIIAGMLLDRYGSRYTLTIALLLTSTGIMFFALASSKNMLIIGSFLLGIGSSFAFVGGVYLTMCLFPFYRFALMIGLLDSVAFIGTGIVDQVISIILCYLSWKLILFIFSILSFFLSFLVYLTIQDSAPMNNKIYNKNNVVLFTNFLKIISNLQIWLCISYNALLFGTIIAFSSFWNFLYQSINHRSLEVATLANGMILLGISIGAPFVGWLSNRISCRRLPMQLFAIGAFISIVMILYYPKSQILIYFLMFSFGFFSGSYPLGYAVGRENISKEGRATMVGVINTFTFGGIAFLQFFPGLLLNFLKTHVFLNIIDKTYLYYVVFSIFPICIFIVLCSTFFIRETYCVLKDD